MVVNSYIPMRYTEDAALFLGKISNDSVDLTVTSPPYDDLRQYQKTESSQESAPYFTFGKFKEIAKELYRVTKNGGVVVWVVGDQVINKSESGTSFKQALYFVEVGFNLHDTMIYQKPNFSNPSKGRYHQTFEYMFVFSKGKPKTFNPIKDRKNICAGQIGSYGKNTYTLKNGQKKERKKTTVEEYGMRHNVWLLNTSGQSKSQSKSRAVKHPVKHPATFPYQLAKDHILSWSNENDLVIDPFCGSGTTLYAAQETKRRSMGCDIIDWVETQTNATDKPRRFLDYL